MWKPAQTGGDPLADTRHRYFRWNVPELLKHFGLPNTPANRDVVVEWLAKVLCTRKDPR
jgi:hypothetical protein